MKALKRILRRFKQKIMSSVGIESPSLNQRKLAKRMVEEMGEAIRGRQEETNQAK